MQKVKPLPAIITAFSFIILFSLGAWQVKRLMWKTHVIHDIETKLQIPAIELPEEEIIDLEQYKYRKVKVHGKLLHDKEIHLYAGSRSYKGDPGYLILTPLKRADGSHILINRGWVPEKKKNSEKRLETLIPDAVDIEGFLFEDEKRTWATPDNDIKKNLWLWIDMKEIKNHLGLEMPNYYIMRKHYDDNIPIGKNLEPKKVRNDHLAYAIIWFGLAISLLVMFIISLMKEEASERKL